MWRISILALLLSVLSPGLLAAQALRWERTFSGLGHTEAWAGTATPDGGFAVLATSYAGRGLDMTDSLRGGNDMWLIKYAAAGTRQWDRRYGGSRDDEGSAVWPTRDGGYLLAGESTSGRSGDRTQPSRGAWDYWVVKTDALGNKEWDRRFGTDSMDFVKSCWQTADGGYIIAGHTWNNTPSATPPQGDKSEPGRGGYDIWIIKLDAQGNKLWDRTLGGEGDDILGRGIPTADGGFLLAGATASAAGGDVTQPRINPNGPVYEDDVWVVKYDAAGTKQWDRRLGGDDGEEALTVRQTRDGGYVLGCVSWSGQDHDHSQLSRGGSDYWILRLSATGQKVWDRRFGSVEDDVPRDILELPGGDLVVAGFTRGPIGGDKTQANFTAFDNIWMLRLAATGAVRWDHVFGGGSDELMGALVPGANGSVMAIGTSSSSVSGTRTQPRRGVLEAWVVKADSLGNHVWDRAATGSGDETQTAVLQTFDSGYLSAGFKQSGPGADVSYSNYGTLNDWWLVKRDSLGVARWDTTFSAEGRDDYLASLQELPDHGLLVGGTMFSGGPDYCSSRLPLDADFEVWKLSAEGRFRWQAQFGGSGDDWLAEARQTADGGSILGGTSRSGSGRDHSEASRGSTDFWLLKINNRQARQWDHRFGGSGLDSLVSVRQTADGGYLLAGSTTSSAGGDVTEPSRGGADFWLVKVNSLGVLQWQRRYGGPGNDWLAAARPTADGGSILLGTTSSGIGGEMTEASHGGRDLWVLKVSDTGLVQWQRRYGGSGAELAATLEIDPDGGYIIGASSTSPVSGDVTQPSRGGTDYWLLRLTSSGTPSWDKRLGGSGEDVLTCLATTRGYGYAVGGKSNSPTASGEHQSTNQGGYDYWTAVLGARRVPLATVAKRPGAALTLFPNPTTGHVTISLAGLQPQAALRAEVLNELGQVVQTQELPFNRDASGYSLDASTLAPGLYVLRLFTTQGPISQTLVKY
ncbi:T9SS type A sorting domain-containing protein [Hymenobacter convexus]|uniref:T9SS type A sorting domain-containing protein n=1 Tax=Hymenobacter sp. CA1UV-4 TaxID=3063782 RepID=UPI00271287E1|nr:T9SS type A sorting domain-containing protein [Hymenobacter sp. CA1UV-4]MDO7850574.1 T9SS type A sorting domain-containing protein [Hymenobacter sp. CA1UV-4]